MTSTLNLPAERRSLFNKNPPIKKSSNSRNTKIHCSTFMRNGDKYILIRKIECVATRDDLPDKYLRVGPWYYQADNGSVFVKGAKRQYLLRVGLYYGVAEFNVIIDLMRAAGKKLTKLNKECRFVVEI